MTEGWVRLLAPTIKQSGGCLVWGEPAREGRIVELERDLGVSLPGDMVDLYEKFDGVGVRHEDTEEVDWVLTPLERVRSLRVSPQESSGGAARRLERSFIPFVMLAGGVEGFVYENDRIVKGYFVLDGSDIDRVEGTCRNESLVRRAVSMRERLLAALRE